MINDWVNLVDCFNNLNKQLEKVSRANKSNVVPTAYIEALVLLEDFLTETLLSKEAKKMSSTNAKALNSMKQKLKKNNKQYEEVLKKYHAKSVDEELKNNKQYEKINHANMVDEEEREPEFDEQVMSDNGVESKNDKGMAKQFKKNPNKIWIEVDGRLNKIFAARGKMGRVEQIE
jgi:translation initiation factor 3 subunit C